MKKLVILVTAIVAVNVSGCVNHHPANVKETKNHQIEIESIEIEKIETETILVEKII